MWKGPKKAPTGIGFGDLPTVIKQHNNRVKVKKSLNWPEFRLKDGS